MTQEERRIYLLKFLLNEQADYDILKIPKDENGQKKLLRSLMNIREPKPIDSDFLCVQDEYLQKATEEKGITEYTSIVPLKNEIYLWQGDITTLRCDAIVNAANSSLLGCFCPCHGCIDNAIHTYAGVELRLECAEIMKRQRHGEPAGRAKITKAYNLPCRYIIHTVGPIINNTVTCKDEEILTSCYLSCLELAEKYHIKSIAFCCISTGEYRFPNKTAANIAVNTVISYKQRTGSKIEVIFNVFKDHDYRIYRELLG